MNALGLFDLLTPYFLGGVDLGPGLHTLLSTVQVDEYDGCFDEFGATVWGVAKLHPSQTNPQFAMGSGNTGAGQSASARSVWDWNDTTFKFRIRVPRTPSTTIANAVNAVGGAPPVFVALFNAWGASVPAAAAGTPPSDYPDTQFELDLLLTLATLHLPMLMGAQLGKTGLLEEDPKQKDVRLVLPKILLRLTQGATIGSTNFALDSWGAETIDDPSDRGEGQACQMIPPLALISGSSSFGFGLDRVIIDTSDSHTPPELLAKFGIGTDFKGLYAPDVRLFFAPGDHTGFAVDIDAHDLVIEWDDTCKISGDFEIDVINQDENPYIRTVIYDTGGNTISADCTTKRSAEFTVVVPKDFTCAIEVHSAVPPYTITVNGPGMTQTDVTAASGFSKAGFTTAADFLITATANNPNKLGGTSQTTATMLLHMVPQSASQQPAAIGAGQQNSLTLTPMPPPDGVHSILLADEHAGKVRFSPGPPVAVKVKVTDDANATVVEQTLSATDTVTVHPPAGKSYQISATWPGSSGPSQPVEIKAWFHFNRPPKPGMPQALQPAGIEVKEEAPKGTAIGGPTPYGVPKHDDLADSSSHREVGTSKDSGATGNFPAAFRDSPEFQTFLGQIPPNATTPVEIRGFASYEHHDPMQPYNVELSERRAVALAELIADALNAKKSKAAVTFTTMAQGNETDDVLLPGGVSALKAWGPNATPNSSYDPSDYWMAFATYSKAGTASGPSVVNGTLTAPAAKTTPVPPPATVQPTDSANKSRPDWFRYAKLLVRISQNRFIALELSGEVKFDTAANDLLQQQAKAASLPPAKNLPGNSNPTDGTTDFDFILSHDDSTGTWAGQLTIAAGKNDKDGLLRFGTPPADDSQPPAQDLWLNFFGTSIVFAPLIDAVEKSVTNKGTLAKVGTAAGTVAALAGIAALDGLRTETITLYGATLSFSEGDAGDSSALMFDVEVDLYINFLGLVKTLPTKPVKVRYKSVGVKVGSKDATGHPTLPVYFDPSKGYDIDLTDPGTFKLPKGLDDIIQVAGARLARTNPLNLELDLAMKDDFGVVSIDKAKVRWPVSPLGVPQITALGATIDIPGAFKASGYLDLSGDGVSGSLDLTIIPLGIRAQAAISIRKADDGSGNTATGVAVSLLVKFPAPIVLGASGLGIYGLIGLFAMHFKRTQSDAQQWYVDVSGDPTHVELASNWVAAIGGWAFGAGLLLGTLDGGLILSLKGMVVLELPGPRLLLFMKATLLSTPPSEVKGLESGTIEATMDLDFGRKTITIGLKIDYQIKPFIEIVIPGNAHFNYLDPSDFQLDLGTIKGAKATVKVLDAFNGSGYLMIDGKEIKDFHPPANGLTGLAVAVGVSVQLIWGSTAARLYLEVTATAALGIGFSPFFVAGSLTIEGSLHLFIVSISASGNLTVTATKDRTTISGGVCGSVDFFFFSVGGCVSFTIGQDPPPAIEAPSLMTSVYLQSRSPALLEGTGTDQPIDTVLLHAPKIQDPSLKTVPIDSIPVLQFAFTPCLDPSFQSSTVITPELAPPATSTGWVKRGPTFFRYAISNIELTGLAGTPALSALAAATWRQFGGVASGDDRGIELALLSWIPFATPSAVVSGAPLDTQITTLFKDTCTPAAPAAAVLWSFSHTADGVSAQGWLLNGVAAPDPPETKRSSPPPTTLKVRELWRGSSGFLNGIAPTTPAYVVSRVVPCLPSASPVQPGPVATGTFNVAEILKLVSKSDVAFTDFQQVAANANLAPLSADLHTLVLPEPIKQIDWTKIFAQPVTPGAPVTPVRPIFPVAPIFPVVPVLPVAPILRAASNVPIQGGNIGSPGDDTILHLFKKTCAGKLLMAPFERTAKHSIFSEPGLAAALARAASAAADSIATKNVDLANALLFETERPTRVRLTLWLTQLIYGRRLFVIRALDKEGKKLVDFPIDPSNSQVLSDASKAPAEWMQTPWVAESFPPDEAAVLLGQTVLPNTRQGDFGPAVLMEVKLPAGTASFLTGVMKYEQISDMFLPFSYAVAVVETWSAAEDERATFDVQVQKMLPPAVDAAITNNQAALPLLAPGGQYKVSVTYTTQTAPVDDTGGMGKAGDASKAITEEYFFRTDSTPPAVLDPWVLTVWPSRDEPFFFHKEPVTVVFSTNALPPLLAAYGVKVVGHSRAASFRHSDPKLQGPGTAIQTLSPKDIPGFVLTPFGEALQNLLTKAKLTCVNASGSTVKHSWQTFDVPLDPLTGYTFDLEKPIPPPAPGAPPAPPPAPGTDFAPKPMYRATFSTSRYGTLEEMVADIGGSRVSHRHVPSGGTDKLALLATQCTQTEMDAALTAAGLGAMAAADIPKLTLLWEDVPGARARPAGLLLDLPEPIQRWRATPTPEHDPVEPDRVLSWSLQPQKWLDLVESGTGSAQKICFNSAGTRVYVMLKSGLVNAGLSLWVNRVLIYPIDASDTPKDYPLLKLTLGNAPWEDA